VAQTVSFMVRNALAGSSVPQLRAAAEEAVRGAPARRWDAEARAVEQWIRKRLRYTRDGFNVETLKTIPRMLRELARTRVIIGDCDDASTLAAAMLLAVGHQPALQILGRGKTPHHVNVLDTTSGVVVDPTGEPTGVFGYRRVYPVR
jgi:hypothetical protein